MNVDNLKHPNPKRMAKGMDKRVKAALVAMAKSNTGPNKEEVGLRHISNTIYRLGKE